MTKNQVILYKAIDEILWNYWDPIGINDCKEARDEYYSYIPQFYSLKNLGASEHEITQILFEIETIRMGLTGNIKNCKAVAKKLVEF